MATIYPWLKAFHVIAVIAWMAGMLYLPRLFVYHCAAQQGSIQSETFKIMERRLLRAIINPAMIATWILGLWLAWMGPDSRYEWFWLRSGWWLWLKIALVLALSAVHGLFARWAKAFAADSNPHSQRFYRIINEIPTIMIIGIVILAVVRPF
jgi:putative membrane protein